MSTKERNIKSYHKNISNIVNYSYYGFKNPKFQNKIIFKPVAIRKIFQQIELELISKHNGCY